MFECYDNFELVIMTENVFQKHNKNTTGIEYLLPILDLGTKYTRRSNARALHANFTVIVLIPI